MEVTFVWCHFIGVDGAEKPEVTGLKSTYTGNEKMEITSAFYSLKRLA